jgi:hypothetical protein
MPSLKDAIANAKLPNYVPAPAAPTAVDVQPPPASTNSNMRFILPPFNADPDSVRQFESNSPKIRIWPRPQQTGGTGTTTATSATTATAASSSSSSAATVTLLPKTAVFTTNILPAGSSYLTTLQLSKSFQLITVAANVPCEVRIYGTQQAQLFDLPRPTGNPVPPEITQNILTCVTLTTTPFVWGWQNRCGANQDIPQTSSIYVTVFNVVPTSAAPATVSITYLPLETTQ